MNDFDALRRKENDAIGTEFIAPSANGSVFVQPAGIVYQVKTRGRGWGVYRLDSQTHSTRLRDATQTEILQYAGKSRLSAILVRQVDADTWLAWIGRLVVVRLCTEECRAFDSVEIVRSGEFWFVSPNSDADPAIANYLRSLPKDFKGEAEHKGLTRFHREAYECLRAYEKTVTPPLEAMLRKQLAYGGGEYLSHTVGAENLVIEFVVDGERHVASISNDFVGISWGFCLSGRDDTFNLAGISSVIRGRHGRSYYED